MWVIRKRLSCKRCGIRGLPFYAYRYKANKNKHLWGRIYVRQICRICYREEANTNGRRWYRKHPGEGYEKWKKWEKKNHAYRLRYTNTRRRNQYARTHYYTEGDYN